MSTAKSMNKTKNLTRGNPVKLLISFSLPLMLGGLFQQFYTLVDTVIVGRGVGVEALASLGAVEWLWWLIMGLVTGLTQGFSILFAQLYGAEKIRELNKAAGNAVPLAAGAMVLLVICGECSLVGILQLLDTPENIFAGAEIYLRILIGGLPISMFYNLFSALLRALGDSKTPLAGMIGAACVNIGLDLLFVMVFGWGIPGAAVATLIAQCTAMLYCGRAVLKITCLKIEKEDLKVECSMGIHLLKLGIPLMFQNTVIGIGGMVIQMVVNGSGFLFVAGFTATNKLYGMLEIAAISLGHAMTTYVAQNLGAGNYQRIRRGVHNGAGLAMGISLTISSVMLIFGRGILSLFVTGDLSQTEQVLDIAYRYLSVMSTCLMILYLLYIYRSALQGLGETMVPMLSGVAEFVMRVTVVALSLLFVGIDGIYYAEIVSWTGATVLLMCVYYKKIRKFPE